MQHDQLTSFEFSSVVSKIHHSSVNQLEMNRKKLPSIIFLNRDLFIGTDEAGYGSFTD